MTSGSFTRSFGWLASRIVIAKSDYFIQLARRIVHYAETRNDALDSSREKEIEREGERAGEGRNSVTSVHALLARAKLRNTHRRMRNDGNVSREKCTAPRASNRPSILVQRDVRRGVAISRL